MVVFYSYVGWVTWCCPRALNTRCAAFKLLYTVMRLQWGYVMLCLGRTEAGSSACWQKG
jgi:hypothetical protein